ncbi:unnamed protein product [Lupinus luteus]|uniref:Uncharacterized protein n=1 Tax=Lupinus luteus TaxID=3873 RepID=A0AAV1WIU4_LUPLU
MEKHDVDLVINLEIDRRSNINLDGLERISSPNIPPDLEEERENMASQSRNLEVVDEVILEDYALIQNNQTEGFEVLDQLTTPNALAAQESRLVGRLWADQAEAKADTEVGDEILEEITYTKLHHPKRTTLTHTKNI